MGWPDYLILHAGHTLFIEFKAPEGRLSPLQKHVHGILEDHGFRVEVVRSIEHGMELIERLVGVHGKGVDRRDKGWYTGGSTRGDSDD